MSRRALSNSGGLPERIALIVSAGVSPSNARCPPSSRRARAEAEDVGAVIGPMSAHLLRRHVANRAQHHARRVPASGRSSSRVAGLRRSQEPGQPEVEDLRAARRAVTKMLSGFRSRWTTPGRAPRPGRARSARRTRSPFGPAAAAFERALSDSPSSSSRRRRGHALLLRRRGRPGCGMVQGGRRAGLLLEALQAIGVGDAPPAAP